MTESTQLLSSGEPERPYNPFSRPPPSINPNFSKQDPPPPTQQPPAPAYAPAYAAIHTPPEVEGMGEVNSHYYMGYTPPSGPTEVMPDGHIPLSVMCMQHPMKFLAYLLCPCIVGKGDYQVILGCLCWPVLLSCFSWIIGIYCAFWPLGLLCGIPSWFSSDVYKGGAPWYQWFVWYSKHVYTATIIFTLACLTCLASNNRRSTL
eukprot:TRINITY_DN67107_c10_g2_i1.p1 TRINITY_DN67107_c10_g2~~TRINITY_DN67107_c10_g2_i1.p1  ORF type:complete len:212 (+),score=12.76 TRINITY_DN67107_c10_g2_i1:25-636(+)